MDLNRNFMLYVFHLILSCLALLEQNIPARESLITSKIWVAKEKVNKQSLYKGNLWLCHELLTEEVAIYLKGVVRVSY